MKNKKPTDFEQDLARRLKNKKFREYYEEYGKQLEVAYRMAVMRKEAKLSQSQIAKKIGTKQSNVARMEQGEQNFTLSTLTKVARAFGKTLEVNFA